MTKMTFMQFLTEVDVGDLQLAQQQRQKQTVDAERSAGKDVFKKEMTGTTPVKDDVIQTSKGFYRVIDLGTKGITVQQPRSVGGKTQVIQHGTNFKNTGKKTGGGQAIFVVAK